MVMDPHAPANQLSMFDIRLIEAARDGDADQVLLLLGSGANISEQEAGTDDTALHVAVREGHKQIVARLLRAGANPDCSNAMGETPRYLAAMHGGGFEMLFHVADRVRDKEQKKQPKASQDQAVPSSNQTEPAFTSNHAPLWRPRRAF